MGVKFEIDKTDSLDSVGFKPEEYDYWINSAIREKVKRKFSGSGVKGEAFEQSQKRIDDLRSLVRATQITVERSSDSYDRNSVYKASLPSSYWIGISEEVDIVYLIDSPTDVGNTSLVTGTWYKVVQVSGSGDTVTHDGTAYSNGDYFEAASTSYSESTAANTEVYECVRKRQGITEATAATYAFQAENPYSEHNFYRKRAHPLRLFEESDVMLTTDGNYGVAYYYIKYLKIPQYISIDTVDSGDIEEGIYYDVSVNDITYDGTTYNPGDVFLGTTETTFSGSGEVRKTADLADVVLDEIIKEAANMMLENAQDPRYQTHTIETRQSE